MPTEKHRNQAHDLTVELDLCAEDYVYLRNCERCLGLIAAALESAYAEGKRDAAQRAEKVPYEWAIESIVDGSRTERVIAYESEEIARDWFARFPKSYRLLVREAPGMWKSADTEIRAEFGIVVEEKTK